VLLALGGRVEDRPMPAGSSTAREFGAPGITPLSAPLVAALVACLERGERALILRNRRGWAPRSLPGLQPARRKLPPPAR
jgi:primosomal protein N'